MKDLKSGKKKLSDMSLENIGEEVLQGCSEGDVEKMGENITELLPIIQRSGILGNMMGGGGGSEMKAAFDAVSALGK